MELTWISFQFILLVAGTTLAQDFSTGFQQGFQQGFNQQRGSQDNFQQPPPRERGPTRLLSQVPSAVRKQRPIQQSQSSFQQSQPVFQQAPPSFQQPNFQPVRAPPPPPPQPQQQPQQQFFDQPQESFQQPPPQPQQQILEQPRKTFRQPAFQPVRAPPPPPPQPQEQPRETFRQPASSLSQQQKTPSRNLSQLEEDAEINLQQAMNAKYAFAAGVTDGINDQQNLREEARDGLSVKGMYSYSDGYFRRTVHYEADENGYRVIKEENEPIGNGPQQDPNGRADVELHVTPGHALTYSVTSADFQPKSQPAQQSQQSQLSQFSTARRPQPSRQHQAQQQQQLPQEFEQQQF